MNKPASIRLEHATEERSRISRRAVVYVVYVQYKEMNQDGRLFLIPANDLRERLQVRGISTRSIKYEEFAVLPPPLFLSADPPPPRLASAHRNINVDRESIRRYRPRCFAVHCTAAAYSIRVIRESQYLRTHKGAA